MAILNQFMVWLFDTSAADQAGHPELEHSPPWAPWITLLILVFAATWVVALYMRENVQLGRAGRIVMAAIRVTLICLVLFMLHGFAIRPFRTDLPDLVVLLDNSGSMSLADEYDDGANREAAGRFTRSAGMDDLSRISQAKAILLTEDARWLHRLSSKYHLRIYTLDSVIEAQNIPTMTRQISEVTAHVGQSRLGTRLSSILEVQRGRPTSAIVVLTDGITTHGETLSFAAGFAQQRNTPLFAVGLGGAKPPRDIEIANLLVDDIVFANDIVTFDLDVMAHGYDEQTLDIKLLRQDGNDVLSSETVTLSAAHPTTRIRLADRPIQAGKRTYLIQADVLEGETNTDNNAATTEVDVRDEQIRVLLVQSRPNYEFRYLKSLLSREFQDLQQTRRNPIDLDTLLQEADIDYAEIDRNALRVFPVGPDQLSQYDVLVFGDVDPVLLGQSAMRNIVDFVKADGKGLIFIAGQRYMPVAYADTPLAELFPFDVANVTIPEANIDHNTGFYVRPTRLGLAASHMQLATTDDDNSRYWNQLAPLYWFAHISDLKPGTRVLAEHSNDTGPDGANLPIICLQYVGAGKVVFHAVDETRRWLFRRSDDLFGRYWIQTIRFLSRSKLGDSIPAELDVESRIVRQGEPVRFRVRFLDDRQAPVHDDGVEVMIEQRAGSRRRARLNRATSDRGVFEGTTDDLPAGQYHAWIVNPSFPGQAASCDFSVTLPQDEMSRLTMNAADLRSAAIRSGGKYYDVGSVHRLLDDLPTGRQVRVESLAPEPIWNSWRIAGLFVCLITVEWLLRKRFGMI